MDNSLSMKIIGESVRPPLTSCSQNKLTLKSRKSGQFYLLLTKTIIFLDTSKNNRYKLLMVTKCRVSFKISIFHV